MPGRKQRRRPAMQPPEPVLLTAGSVVLAGLNLTVMALLARSVPAGWLLGLGELVLGVPYDIVTRQFGFVAVSVVMAWVYVRGWLNFRRNRAAEAEASDAAA
jgi:hypothetical protein